MKQEALRPFFTLIDDDPINNVLCSSIIKHTMAGAEIIDFTDPFNGLEFIKGLQDNAGIPKTILYLDINMPLMNGWDFMKAFDTLDTAIKQKVMVYILSSSVDPHDIERAKVNPNITGYYIKPLRKEDILDSLEAYGKE